MFHIFTLVPSHWNFTHSHKYTPLYLKHFVKEAENSRERKKGDALLESKHFVRPSK